MVMEVSFSFVRLLGCNNFSVLFLDDKSIAELGEIFISKFTGDKRGTY